MPIKIVVTGPESTGKTTLCTQLSERYKGTMIPEFSRAYLQKTNGYYDLKDLENIGLTQNIQNNAGSAENRITICDTDALTTLIWASEKFKVNSVILKNDLQINLPDLYLLCYPDLKWEHDVLRENPDDLDRLFMLYFEEIVKVGATYDIVYGIGSIRTNRAVFFINNRFPELNHMF